MSVLEQARAISSSGPLENCANVCTIKNENSNSLMYVLKQAPSTFDRQSKSYQVKLYLQGK